MAFMVMAFRSKYFVVLLFAMLAGAALWRAGYVRGQSVVQSAWDSEQARTAAGIIKNMEVQRANSEQMAQLREADRTKQRATFRRIRRKAASDVGNTGSCALSDAGLRDWNNANAGATSVSGQPDGEVPQPADGE